MKFNQSFFSPEKWVNGDQMSITENHRVKSTVFVDVKGLIPDCMIDTTGDLPKGSHQYLIYFHCYFQTNNQTSVRNVDCI